MCGGLVGGREGGGGSGFFLVFLLSFIASMLYIRFSCAWYSVCDCQLLYCNLCMCHRS